jgi:hypothetical protein
MCIGAFTPSILLCDNEVHMYTHLNKNLTVAIVVAVFALSFIAYVGFGVMKNDKEFRQPLLGETAIVDGTKKNEKVVTPQPLSTEAIAAVSVPPPASSVNTPTSPASAQASLSLFAGKKTSSIDVTGVIEMVDPAQGIFTLEDAQKGTRYTVFANADTKITRGGETLTFAALKVADIVHVYGKHEAEQQLISASSIAVTGALPLPSAAL